MIHVDIKLKSVNDINVVMDLLQQAAVLVQSTDVPVDSEFDFEVSTAQADLKVNVVLDTQEKFDAIEINCCK